MANTPLLATIIMAARDKATYLDLTLASLERQIVPTRYWEIVVTDDASEDNTSEILQHYQERGALQLHWRRSEQCRGRSGARNDALELARGRTIVFLDDDRIVERDFLFWHLVHQIEEQKTVIGDIQYYINTHVGPDLDPKLWETAQLILRSTQNGTEMDVRSHRIVHPEDLDHPERLAALTSSRGADWQAALLQMDQKNVPYPELWIYFTTGNASAPREQITALGGFDEEYVGWGLEDNDICIRLQKAGLSFRYEPRAITLHQRHAAGPQKWEEYRANFDRFMRKHPEADTTDNRWQCQGGFHLRRWIGSHQERRQAMEHHAAHQSQSSSTPTGSIERILWCVPASGIGQARRSASLCRELLHTNPDFQVRWISSGPAATWLREKGFYVEDTETNTLRSRFDTYTAVIKGYRPHLVISDDDPLVLPIAHHAEIPSLYLTSHLADERETPEAAYYPYARRILFADLPGSFMVPRNCFAGVDFCGPWVEPERTVAQETYVQWRALLNALERKLIVITLEKEQVGDTAFVQKVVKAVSNLPTPVSIAVLAGSLHKSFKEKRALPAEVVLLDTLPDPMSLLRCADLVITPGDHTLLWELAAAGVPTLVCPRHPDHEPSSEILARRMQKLPTRLRVLDQTEEISELLSVIETLLASSSEQVEPIIDFAARLQEGVQSIIRYAY